MASSNGPTAPETWHEYIEREVDLLMEQAGPKLVEAFVHSRAIEHPEYYKKHREKDLAQAHFGITKAGYWERVALRALVLLQVPFEERERLIDEALAREQAAREAVRKKLAKGPGGPHREVDLSGLEL